MDRRERLQARYETARDALLLDRETEGPRQKGERKAARRAAGKHRRMDLWKGMGKAVGKMAILVAVLLGILFLVFRLFPEVRTQTYNGMIDAWESRFDRPAHLPSNGPVPEVKEISLAWIPDGFVLEDEMFAEGAWRWQYYINAAENADLFVEKMIPQKITIDTEDAGIEEIRVQRYQAKLITEDACVTVFWANQDNGRVYCIMAEGVPKEDVLKVAEGFT